MYFMSEVRSGATRKGYCKLRLLYERWRHACVGHICGARCVFNHSTNHEAQASHGSRGVGVIILFVVMVCKPDLNLHLTVYTFCS